MLQKIGTINNIKVFRDTDLNTDEIFVGRKGNAIIDPGIIYVPNENFENCNLSSITEDEIKTNEKYNIDNITFIIGRFDDIAIYENFFKYLSNGK